MSIAYKQIVEKYGATSVEDIVRVFDNEIVFDWVDLYKSMGAGLYGEITLQKFQEFTYVFDCTEIGGDADIAATNLPDSRVIAVYGYSNTNVNISNRKMMRKHLGATTKAFEFFGNYIDKGHFISHMAGGPIDINLFPQRRDINRGWSAEGKKYRDMEKFVADHPQTFVFSRPIYNDFSCCPSKLEYGYCDTSLNFNVAVFPNR